MNLTDQLGVAWRRGVCESTQVAVVCCEWPWGVGGGDSGRLASANPVRPRTAAGLGIAWAPSALSTASFSSSTSLA